MTAEAAPRRSRRAAGRAVRAWASSPAGFLTVVAIACVLAYLPSRNGPFLFDAIRNIVENPNVRMTRLDLASLWRAMIPHDNLNLRPLSFLTFALNHLVGDYDPAGYHLVNLAVLLLSVPVAPLLALRLGSAWLAPPEARVAALGTCLYVRFTQHRRKGPGAGEPPGGQPPSPER